MSSHVLELHDVSYSYGDHQAVRGVDVRVDAGEIYALLGVNGAGKTTTLEMLEGLRRPSSGSVTFLGADPHAQPSIRKRAGIMLQESGFANELTSRETVDLFASLSGRSDDVGRTLDRVELAHKADAKVSSLSGGERRRLDFALAIFGQPEVIVMDEPTTGLDPESRDRLWRVACEEVARGAGVLVTTHYLEEAEQHADRIGIMDAGCLTHEGSLSELVSQRPTVISLPVVDRGPAPPPGGEISGGELRMECAGADVERTLTMLLTWARDSGVDLSGLSVRPASLRQIFRDIAEGDDRA